MKITLKQYEDHSITFGNLQANICALLLAVSVILFSWVGAVFCFIMVFVEKKSGMVKRYAALLACMSLAFFVVLSILSTIRSNLPWYSLGAGRSLLGIVIWLVRAARFAACIGLIVTAYRYQYPQIQGIESLLEKVVALGGPAIYDGNGPVPPEATYTAPTGPQPYNPAQPGAPTQQYGTPAQPGAPVQQPAPNYSQPQQQASVPPQQATPQYGQAPAPAQLQPEEVAQPASQPMAPVAPAPVVSQPVQPMPPKDPNDQLPPEMRDGPAPKFD